MSVVLGSRKIDILATIGPSSFDEVKCRKMEADGVDIFRINLSHTKIEDLKSVCETLGKWVTKPVCVDTEGPQLRTMSFEEDILCRSNEHVILTDNIASDLELTSIAVYPISPKDVFKVGDIVSLDFNSVIIQVVDIAENGVVARVISGGTVGSNKAIAVDRDLDLPAFTEKDLKAFEVVKELGLDHLALSFASSGKNVLELRSHFDYPINVVSKIESHLGLTNLVDILCESDAVLIDRGDLSRDVPIERIVFAQRHIIGCANRAGKPVYVATNLLESMRDTTKPTRAEIHDVVNTVMLGADGLVLAAETAIGKHPLHTVRVVTSLAYEALLFSSMDSETDTHKYLCDQCGYGLMKPHGGKLVNLITPIVHSSNDTPPVLELDYQTISDAYNISVGMYSPLQQFMNKDVLESVLEYSKLPNGFVWTMPVLLQVEKVDIDKGKIQIGSTVHLQKDGVTYAMCEVESIEKIDREAVAKRWFGTADIKHPGVASFFSKGDYIISGSLKYVQGLEFDESSHFFTPKQCRNLFNHNGWRRVVAFHTRNVVHRGHEFIQKYAAEKCNADAIFISPVIGIKKKGDFNGRTIINSYEALIRGGYYRPYDVVIGALNTYSRYCGPREAVFTALCRKNLGCSHFIVGRDHTGVGNYYAKDASQKIFDEVGDIGITPIFVDEAYFCENLNDVVFGCPDNKPGAMKISGTKLRNCIDNRQDIPGYLVRPEVEKVLKDMICSDVPMFE